MISITKFQFQVDFFPKKIKSWFCIRFALARAHARRPPLLYRPWRCFTAGYRLKKNLANKTLTFLRLKTFLNPINSTKFLSKFVQFQFCLGLAGATEQPMDPGSRRSPLRTYEDAARVPYVTNDEPPRYLQGQLQQLQAIQQEDEEALRQQFAQGRIASEREARILNERESQALRESQFREHQQREQQIRESQQREQQQHLRREQQERESREFRDRQLQEQEVEEKI